MLQFKQDWLDMYQGLVFVRIYKSFLLVLQKCDNVIRIVKSWFKMVVNVWMRVKIILERPAG